MCANNSPVKRRAKKYSATTKTAGASSLMCLTAQSACQPMMTALSKINIEMVTSKCRWCVSAEARRRIMKSDCSGSSRSASWASISSSVLESSPMTSLSAFKFTRIADNASCSSLSISRAIRLLVWGRTIVLMLLFLTPETSSCSSSSSSSCIQASLVLPRSLDLDPLFCKTLPPQPPLPRSSEACCSWAGSPGRFKGAAILPAP
mmetsp:Transcript_29902/g.78805  ORF Transcript_29902/g.78805 Transcript_29902/m.78805 type:complete len:205 (-) Transcript_29902:328-942(-)